ncbi:glutathione S-transferase Mu 1 isoform 1-T1 [Ctenodactylus gundi]
MPMILGYWNLRGLTHPIRLLLEYTDSRYEEKHYTMGDAPDFDRSQWLNEKFKLGLDFPNLPYLIDGAHKLTQSNAIMRYIARKHNMCGETEEEKIRVDMLENQAMDTRMQLIMLCYSPDFEKKKPEFLEGLPEKMKLFSQFLGKRPWFAGDKITFVDFLTYDVLDQHRMLDPKCLDAFPNLKDFLSRFELGHAIRLLLEYTDSSYEERRYIMGNAPDYDRSQWLNEKFKLGLDFPNLPYLIDGAHKLTQSNAILRYIARKHNMCGETEEEKIRVDILENQAMDTRLQLRMLCYDPDFEKKKPEFLEGIPDKMKLFSQFLGKRPWFAGDKITFVDFLAYDALDQHRIFDPKCLDAFPNLKDFLSRFEGLKNISAYMKSSRFLPGPLYLKLATWGNK